MALLVAVASWIQPINSAFYRATFLIGSAVFLLAIFALLRGSALKFLFLTVVGLAAYSIHQGKPTGIDRQAFESVWVQSAMAYEGVPYRFGGESFMGMDSGGLLRRAMVMTQIKLAAQHLNPYFLKRAYYIWSSPFSLASLLHPTVKWVEFIGYYAPNRSVAFRPGDILISRNRSEMAIYLGDQKVLGISPKEEKVGVHLLGDSSLLLFSSWCYVLRWNPNQLGEPLMISGR